MASKAELEEIGNLEPLSLGEIIEQLKQMPSGMVVMYDFGRFSPTTVDIYRGFYEDLALGFDDGYGVTVNDLLKILTEALDKTFTGYFEDRTYLMGKKSLVWAANYGETSGVSIIGVVNRGSKISLVTAETDFH